VEKPLQQNTRPAVLLLLALCIAILAPIWFVDFFVNNDGSGHLYISHVMLEQLRGGTFFNDKIAFNTFALPNSLGHWLIVGLLPLFSPAVVTKLVMTVTFVFLATSFVCLRMCVFGDDDLVTTVLLGVVASANGFWLQGSYNYILATAGFAFALGLFFRWRNDLTILRLAVISSLITLVYFGHLISFCLLLGSLIVLAIFVSGPQRFRVIAGICIGSIPSVFLFFVYLLSKDNAEPFVPHWRQLADPLSIQSWSRFIVSSDPFGFISRQTIPFSNLRSPFLALASPWLLISIVLLIVCSVTAMAFRRDLARFRHSIPFAILFILTLIGAVFGPGDFGLRNGSVLRERLFLMSVIVLTGCFTFSYAPKLARICQALLLIVVLFQIAALWEYAFYADNETSSFMAARDSIPEGTTIASVVFDDRDEKFRVVPLSQLDNLIGVGRNVFVWDNYELGHNLFPVVATKPEDRSLAHGLSSSNTFSRNESNSSVDQKLTNLGSALRSGKGRVDFLLVYGSDPRIAEIVEENFASVPVYANGPLQILKAR
jgi:hypothetical protein